ncbi:bifunctional folylpolyglutamate synthase/dihydrofolate synthase [Methylophilaceae bacterium]|jgi:dihydrofolate synthase / folylpolyglutamate synthase|nr:bifunctional folylpolyglutamate synthase/dihydrofolate synthase [Methylophilaceae bacterium]
MGLDRVGSVKNSVNLEPIFPIITVGGTNGKGSVCAFLETIYSKAGYSVGCFTSPHLFKFNERIRIDLEQVKDKTIIKSLDLINSKKKLTKLTYFEITTLAAMNIFIEQKVDIAILEVGLGGRLDAVNIFEPDLSIITSIGMDHQEFLGDTIEEIAHEKSGICRPHKHTILNFENIPKSMIMELNKLKTSLSILNEDYSYNLSSKNYSFRSNNISMSELPAPQLKGNKQLTNLAGCLRAISLLQSKIPVTLNSIKNGIRDTKINGRLQILSKQPYILADVAHNYDATINLYNFFSTSKKSGKVYAVFSILENKNTEQVLMPFADIVDEWFISEIKDNRAQKIDVIINTLKKYNNKVVISKFNTLDKAYENARNKSNLNDNIIIYGSFFAVSEIMKGIKI